MLIKLSRFYLKFLSEELGYFEIYYLRIRSIWFSKQIFCNVIITTLKHFLCNWSIDNFVFDMSAVFFRTWYLCKKSLDVLETNFLAILIWHLSLSAFSIGIIFSLKCFRLPFQVLLCTWLFEDDRKNVLLALIWHPSKSAFLFYIYPFTLLRIKYPCVYTFAECSNFHSLQFE